MFETIQEPVEIVGIYAKGIFHPKKFRWRRVIYPIQEITFAANIKDGNLHTRMYGALSRGTLYRLMFNRNTEHWSLEEIWCE